jgi:hypothetical protein
MNIYRIGAGWFHADGMKDKGRLKVTFQNFAIMPKKDTPVQFICYGIVQTPAAKFRLSSYYVFVTV